MLTFFAIVGVLAVVSVTISVIVYVLDRPAVERRLQMERQAQESAWLIYMHAREAMESMLESARRPSEEDR